jgi:DNA-binding NtrC family response regulator
VVEIMVKARLLIVDDEPAIHPMIQKLLHGRADWELVSAHTASQALARFSPHAFDLVLLDRNLPDRSGTDVAVDLRSLDPSVGIALMTGDGALDGFSETLHWVVDLYVEKPFTSGIVLVKQLGMLVEHSRRRREQAPLELVPTQSLPAPRALGSSARVAALVVSPVRSEREWMAQQLSESCSVHQVATSSAALAMVELAPVDLLVVDAEVRDPDPLALITSVNELIIGLRSAVIANRLTVEQVNGYLECGVSAFFNRPLHEAEFASRIARLLRAGKLSVPAPAFAPHVRT